MSRFDLVVLLLAGAAGFGGWRLGFVARITAWIGLLAGILVAGRFIPFLARTLGGTGADDRVLVTIVFLGAAALIGQLIGRGAGVVLRGVLPGTGELRTWDRAAGATAGSLGVLLLAWLAVPTLATAPGWPARTVRDSTIVRTLEDLLPPQPGPVVAWGRKVSGAIASNPFDWIDAPPDPGPVPDLLLPEGVDRRVRGSVLTVSARGCGTRRSGTAFVAGRGLLVTNAHVVAGTGAPVVADERGREYGATVGAFDARRDVAVLVIPGFAASPLPLARATPGAVGVVYGFPGGGPLDRSSARIGRVLTAVGTDITGRHEIRRRVEVLAARLRPGDSGAPFVDPLGRVIGLAFAIDPVDPTTAYALTPSELGPALESAQDRIPVATGACPPR
ncbi:MAG: CvpA family protein [Actinomycetota bacterium]